jgi:hypothetical protein
MKIKVKKVKTPEEIQKNKEYYEKNRDRILKDQQEKRKKKYEGLVEGYDYICCKECEFKSSELAVHIISKHKMTVDDYKIKHNVSSVKSQKAIDRVKGKNNPAYQHGGRLSPFSEKFFKGTDKIEETKIKAKTNKQILNKDTTKLEYWLEKTNGDTTEAQKLLSERQSTFSLEKCIERHGEEKGKEIWLNRQERWLKTLNNKSVEEKNRINRLKVGNGYSISKAERELLQIFLSEKINMEHQFSIYDENNNKQYLYDFRYKNKIIEYHGDWWHCNPKKYNKDYYHPRVKLTAEDIWKKDNRKENYARNNNFELLIIWENDYKKDKQGTIETCLNFLNQ